MIGRIAIAAQRRARAMLLGKLGRSTSQTYVMTDPSPQNALDLFRGEWQSAMPAPLDGCRAGNMALFADTRLQWALTQLPPLDGKTIVELGPLEGSHTYALEKAGAADIVAIEAHPQAYLKCLVFKELTGLTRAHFLCGDFMAYLRRPGQHFDVGIASGVLYHMSEPIDLIARLASTCDAVYLWTHYYDHERIAANRRLDGHFHHEEQQAEFAGFRHSRWRQRYLVGGFWRGFCGGPAAFSHWLSRDGILGALRHFGFDDVRVGCDEPDHFNGPSFGIVARRSGSASNVQSV
jgi:hypothetical protein